MNKLMRAVVLLLSLSTLIFSSCDNSLVSPEEITSDNETSIHRLTYSFSYENSMYQKTKGALADVFDEFYEKIITGELVAETYVITFQEVESGATYSFSGSWEDATVELQAATYKVTGTSTAEGEKSQSKCSILFDETITITNDQTDIVLNAYYDCFLFVMTSEKLKNVDNCYLFNNKYWYAFVNNKFVDTLTGSHKDGTNFSVKMDDYNFDKGKYYIYEDVSINEYSVYFLISKMENGLEEVKWDGFTLTATSPNTVILKKAHPDGNVIEGELYYSMDASNWVIWNNGTEVSLELNQQLFLKGNKHHYDGDCQLEVLNGSAYGNGYIMSLFENGTDYQMTNLPDLALRRFFVDNGKITGELKFPEGVKNIGTTYIFSYSFEGPWWTSIILPSTVEVLGATCFEDTQITEITIPKSVKYIGSAAFNACYKLSTVYFTGTVAEWNAVEKLDYRWIEDGANEIIPAKTIICTDGIGVF